MKRNIQHQLKEWKAKAGRYPLIIQGARQVGKTYALKQFGQENYPNFHYINLENEISAHKVFEGDLNPQLIIENLSFYLKTQIDPAEDLLILDELQSCPRAITSLKYFSEKMPGFDLVATGSLLGIYLGEASFPVGKVEFLNMFPLSFNEFLDAVGEKQAREIVEGLKPSDQIPELVHHSLWARLKEYFVTGGLPSVVEVYRNNLDDKFSAMQKVREEQNRLLNTYLADIAKHSGKQNSMHIERVLRAIPQQLASRQDGNAAKFKFKGVIPGRGRYSQLVDLIDWLLLTRLAIKVPFVNHVEHPLSAYAQENQFRLLLFDVGLLGALSGLDPGKILDYDYGTYKGFFAENFIAQEFVCADQRFDQIFTWHGGNLAEVEFLRESQGEILPIEVKSGLKTQAKSLKVFAEKYHSQYRTIMSAANFSIKDTVHKYPLYLAARFPLS